MFTDTKSAMPCGCDEGANHYCEWHHKDALEKIADRIYAPLEARIMGQVQESAAEVFTTGQFSIASMQRFEGGATRNVDAHKYDYEAFLNPEVLYAYGEFMHSHRLQRDGTLRDGDNWQKGIPFKAYAKSLVRHTFDLWRMHRGFAVTNPDSGQPHTKQELCCAIMFNVMGYLKELLAPSPINVEGK